MLEKIVSGGQTGVDRAALDVALQLGIPCGGWCPKGRKAEDGRIANKYPLEETESELYQVRTERNVRDSDGTLILLEGKAEGGTALTLDMAERMNKPYLRFDLANQPCNTQKVVDWLKENAIRYLNVAGPRESSSPGIYQKAINVLTMIIETAKHNLPKDS